jgi:hypothetical protein
VYDSDTVSITVTPNEPPVLIGDIKMMFDSSSPVSKIILGLLILIMVGYL